MSAHLLRGLRISAYADDRSDVVTLGARPGHLNDGTTYPSDTTFRASAKDLKITVQNTGYRNYLLNGEGWSSNLGSGWQSASANKPRSSSYSSDAKPQSASASSTGRS